VLQEQVFKNGSGKVERPLQSYCNLSQRGYSFKLQRMITHAGANESFDQAIIDLAELSDIELSKTEIRRITLAHGQTATTFHHHVDLDIHATPDKIRSEVDGSMLPLLERPDNLPEGTDKRKHKKRIYKEIRLCYAQNIDQDKDFYHADFVYQDDIKPFIQFTLDKVGYKHGTSQVYAIGDGANWIYNTYKSIDPNSHYTVDYYHLSEYLIPFAPEFIAKYHDIAPSKINDKYINAWMSLTCERLKQNEIGYLYEESKLIKDTKQASEQFRQYVANRWDRFDYQTLVKQDLPIGSGLIEGAHKSILQKRLKKSGVGWEINNIKSMIHLRLLAANELWDHYWDCQWILHKAAA